MQKLSNLARYFQAFTLKETRIHIQIQCLIFTFRIHYIDLVLKWPYLWFWAFNPHISVRLTTNCMSLQQTVALAKKKKKKSLDFSCLTLELISVQTYFLELLVFIYMFIYQSVLSRRPGSSTTALSGSAPFDSSSGLSVSLLLSGTFSSR